MIVRGKRSPALSAFGQVVKPVLIAPMGTIEEEGGTKAGVKRKAFTANTVAIPTETIREEVPTTSVPEPSYPTNESKPQPESEDVQEPAESPFMLGIPMSRNTKKGAEFGFEVSKNNETEELVAPQPKKQALSVLSKKEESNFSENEMKVKTEPRDEIPKLDSIEEKPKGDPPKQEPEKVEPQQTDPPKQEPQQTDPPKPEPEKVENPKEALEQPHTDPSEEVAPNNEKKNDKQNGLVRQNPIPDYELILQLNSNSSVTQSKLIESEIKKPELPKSTKSPFGNSPFSKEKPEEDIKKKEEIEAKKQLELKKIEENKKKLNDQKALLEAQKKGTEERPNPFKQNPFNKLKQEPSIGEKKSQESEVREENPKPVSNTLDEKKSEVPETSRTSNSL
jgi:hypothetical protein